MRFAEYNEFNLRINSVTDGTQPATTLGPSIVPGNNTYGSYVTLITGSLVTDDAFGIVICANGNNTSTAARDTIMTIGLDAAGSNNYTDFIQHLLVTDAGQLTASNAHAGAVWYYFPVFIKAGSSIGAKASVNNATVGNFQCFVTLFCQPTRPELVRAGSFVRTFGADTANSRGTLITEGTSSEGSWTELGTITDSRLWFWEVGFGANNAATSAGAHFVDVGLGDPNANIKLAIQNSYHYFSTLEAAGKRQNINSYRTGVIGNKVYGRSQASTAEISASLIAYGVGG